MNHIALNVQSSHANYVKSIEVSPRAYQAVAHFHAIVHVPCTTRAARDPKLSESHLYTTARDRLDGGTAVCPHIICRKIEKKTCAQQTKKQKDTYTHASVSINHSYVYTRTRFQPK